MATKYNTKLHVKKGDTVMVISGNYKGETGEVLEVIPGKRMVIVDGVNVRKKHPPKIGPRSRKPLPRSASRAMMIGLAQLLVHWPR